MSKNTESNSVEDAFQSIRNRTNNLIKNFLPDAWEKFNSAFDYLGSESSEKWSNATHSCRRIIEALANLVKPLSMDTRVFKGKDKPSLLGNDKYLNRILAFLEDAECANTLNLFIKTNLIYYCNALFALYAGTNKGSHSITTKAEAERYVLNTYLLVGDILTLWYENYKLENLIEGLDNTVIYKPENNDFQINLMLYYKFKISPYKVTISRDHPIGLKFLVYYKKNKIKQMLRVDLQSLVFSSLTSEKDANFNELNTNFYVQIGAHIFNKNKKNPLLLIAVGDGLVHLTIIIIKYIPPSNTDEISKKNWKILKILSGQQKVYIMGNSIYLPFGTMGLGHTYNYINEKFIEENGVG